MPKSTLPPNWSLPTQKPVDKWSSLVRMPPPVPMGTEHERVQNEERGGRVGFEPTIPAMSRWYQKR
jgi:hypothetical protein